MCFGVTIVYKRSLPQPRFAWQLPLGGSLGENHIPQSGMRTPAPRTVCLLRSDSPHGLPQRKKDTSFEVSFVVTRGRIELPFQP